LTDYQRKLLQSLLLVSNGFGLILAFLIFFFQKVTLPCNLNRESYRHFYELITDASKFSAAEGKVRQLKADVLRKKQELEALEEQEALAVAARVLTSDLRNPLRLLIATVVVDPRDQSQIRQKYSEKLDEHEAKKSKK